MQRVLEKMAKQLNEYDEASLMQLWQHYATRVQDFEPTKRWEEAAISLCLIQAVHWKNQLFNYHLAVSATPADKTSLPPLPDVFAAQRTQSAQSKETPGVDESAKAKATVLRFPEKGKNGTGSGNDPEAGGEKGEASASHPEGKPESDG